MINRFNDHAMELLTLASNLVPKKDFEVFNVDDICLLVEKYYPADFTKQKRIQLRLVLQNSSNSAEDTSWRFPKLKCQKNQILSGVSSITQLCTSVEEEIQDLSFDQSIDSTSLNTFSFNCYDL
ncbi:hypothetical protein LXL04_004050 [Taraxacum kok-saghyz]